MWFEGGNVVTRYRWRGRGASDQEPRRYSGRLTGSGEKPPHLHLLRHIKFMAGIHYVSVSIHFHTLLEGPVKAVLFRPDN